MSNLKCIFFWVVTTIFCGNLIAQSKKEQILILSNKLDSLNSVLNKERSLSLEKIKTLNSEISLTEKKLGATNVQINEVSNQLYYASKEIEALDFTNKILKLELFSLQKENSSLKLKLASMMNLKFTNANSLNKNEIEMVFVEGGTFQMGSNNYPYDEKPIHSVVLSSFKIGKYEVTQRQWKVIMSIISGGYSDCDSCPIQNVSWDDAQEFIRRLNVRTGLNYRLPTEAEWEYAARGGKESKGYIYSGSNDLGSVAWCSENSGDKTHVVGTKLPNELGIYDMTGNVWEWCADWYGLYTIKSQKNPSGPSADKSIFPFFRIRRGGSCLYNDYACRNTYRSPPGSALQDFGFRLVLPVSP